MPNKNELKSQCRNETKRYIEMIERNWRIVNKAKNAKDRVHSARKIRINGLCYSFGLFMKRQRNKKKKKKKTKSHTQKRRKKKTFYKENEWANHFYWKKLESEKGQK